MKLLALDTATEGTRELRGEGPARGSRDRRQGERVQRFGGEGQSKQREVWP